jgi:hypothetical protein
MTCVYDGVCQFNLNFCSNCKHAMPLHLYFCFNPILLIYIPDCSSTASSRSWLQ